MKTYSMSPYAVKIELMIFLRTLKNKGALPTELYNTRLVSGFTPGVMYGTVTEIHKDGMLTRPVLSAINTYNYNLAKF